MRTQSTIFLIKILGRCAERAAAAFFEIVNDPDMHQGFVMYAINGIKWDDAEEADRLAMEMKELEA